jgi:hypothetical protein
MLYKESEKYSLFFFLNLLTNNPFCDIIIIEIKKEVTKMAQCPNCGSSAQPKVVGTEYNEDGWTIKVVRTYKCGCGQMFTGTSYHTCKDGYEYVEKIKNRG